MARTLGNIKNEMTTNFMGNGNIAALYGFQVGDLFSTTFSTLSLENFIFDIISFAIFTHELLFDQHKAEVNTTITNQKNYRTPWYATMAKAFQYGHALVSEADYYDNTGLTDAEVEAAQIVKYAAVNESDDESRVIIKIATEDNNVLAPIEAAELTAFEEYLRRIRPAGVKTTVINFLPDRLYLNLSIYRDPLVLDANGMSILNGNYPVEEAIAEYMKELPFNGQFVIAHFVDKLQQVEGVEIPHVNNIQSSWIDATSGGYGTPTIINVKRIPESGYFEVVNYNNITYVV